MSIKSTFARLPLIGQRLLTFQHLCNLFTYSRREQRQTTDKSGDLEKIFSKLNNLMVNDRSVAIKNVENISFRTTGRPSMDILVRSWQDLGKILAKILPRVARCHGKILSREPCSQENFYCKILFGWKRFERKSTKIYIYADLHC